MHPQKWQPGGFNKKPSSFRKVSANRSNSYESRFPQRSQRRYVPAGMFAYAKSSIPLGPPVDEPPPFSHSLPDSPPRKISKFSNFPRPRTANQWDFSDIARPKIQIKKLNSEEEISSKNPEKSIISGTSKIQKKPFFPWDLDIEIEDDKMIKAKKMEPFEVPSGFEDTLNRFSARMNSIPSIPLQNHTETTMATVEKALMAVALSQKNSVDRPETFPVFNLLVERSDWLLYREEYNDETDYCPSDPFYSHDVISSDFEEYEQDLEESNVPTYPGFKDDGDEEEKIETKKMGQLNFFGEELDSQEDFFTTNFPSTSGMDPSSSSIFASDSSTSMDSRFFPSSSNYSPFNYSLFSQSTEPPSTSSNFPF